MKKEYVRVARRVRSIARAVGVLDWLDRRATTSRWALWARSLLSIFDVNDLVRLDVPWWTFEASDRVEQFLARTPGARIFEWGSGASTVWLARRAGSVRTVEHDEEWARSIRGLLADSVELILAPATPLAPGEGVPSVKPGHEGLDFTDYVTVIDRDAATYDLIVIDGRAREACMVRALEHLSPGGMVVFDNVDRERYRIAIANAIAGGAQLDVVWTRGLTPALPYPTRTALLSGST